MKAVDTDLRGSRGNSPFGAHLHGFAGTATGGVTWRQRSDSAAPIRAEHIQRVEAQYKNGNAAIHKGAGNEKTRTLIGCGFFMVPRRGLEL